ncbi:unnamed protein product [Closterium sp. NIES-54]
MALTYRASATCLPTGSATTVSCQSTRSLAAGADGALQDGGVHQFTPAYERVTHCTCARTGRHLATFTRQPGSDLYTLTTGSPQVAASASASASGQLSTPCSCRSLAHETVLWHHRLGHPSVQRLRAMHSRYLVSGLPRVLPSLPPSPAPTCLPCVEGRQRAAPHSSSFLPTTAPLQTLHMDVWGPARVRGQGQERYFLIVVDDYSRYTTVFPLRTKGEVPDVLIPWIRRARLQLSERFHSVFPVLRLQSDRGGEFSSDLLAAYCTEHGIEQSFTLLASPQQNGVAERRIGLVMEVARTSLIHAAAPHFLWPYAVRYAAHQLNLWPRVSLPETSPTLLWTGEVGDASRFWVWGSRAFVRDASADKLSSRAVPCVFLGFVPDAPGWQFYHATSRRVLPSQDVTFDESVPYYHLFPYHTAPLPPPPLFLAPGAAVVDPLPPQGAAPSGVSQVDPVEPVEVAVDSRPAAGVVPGGAAPGGAETGGAESGGAEPGGAETGGTEPGGAEPGGTEPGGAEPRSPESRGTESGGPVPESPTPGGVLSSAQLREWYLQYCSLRRGTSGAMRTTGAGASTSPPRRELPSRDQIREWYERRCTLRSGAPGVTDPGAAGAAAGAAGLGVGAAAGTADPGVGAAAGTEDPGAGATTGAVEPGVGAAAGTEDSGVGAATGAEDPGAGAAAGAMESGAGAAGPVSSTGAAAEGVGSKTTAGGPAGGTPGAAGGSGAAGGAAGEGAPAGGTGAVLAVSGVAARPRPYFVPLLEQVLGSPPSAGLPPSLACPQPVPSQLQLQPTSPLPTPSPYTGPTGGLTERPEPASRPASPIRPARPSGRGPRQRPPPVPGTHRMSLRPSTAPLRVPLPSPPESSLPALADPESDSLRAASPAVTRLLATAVTDPSFESTAASAFVTELVDFAARCRLDYAASLVAESESVCPPSVGGAYALGTDVLEDRQEEFQCLAAASPHLVSVLLTPEGDPDALDIPTPRSYADAIEGPYSSQWQAAMDAEMASWESTGTYIDAVPPSGANIKRHTCTDLGELRSYLGLLITRDRARRTITLTQSHMVQQVLQCFGFTYSSPQATPLPTRHSLSALPSDESVESSGPYPELVGCLMYLMTCTRPDLAYPLDNILARYVAPGRHRPEHLAAAKRVLRYLCSTSGMGLVLGGQSPVVLTGHADASWADDQATHRSSQGYTFSLGFGSVSWRATRSSSVLGSSCEAEIYAGAMAAQELRWLTYLLTDLGEPPRSPPVLYVDNKAMLALCREQRLEHRTKHIALRYFLARELQQRGQLRLVYVASEANTADVFTKALAPCDHQRFCTQLVGGVLSMCGDVVEELAIGVVSVVGVADVVSATVDVVSATVDVVTSCRIVANARVLSASGMFEDVCELRLHLKRVQCLLLSSPSAPAATTAATATTATATAAISVATAATTATATAATTAATAATAPAATAAPACCATMVLLRVLAFDHKGRPIQFDMWLDDLQLYLLSDSKDSVSLFDLASGAATAPPATADSVTHSQWLTRDAAARLAIRNHLRLVECAHFGQHWTAQALYDAVDARYSSPAIAALGRLFLPYLFPELSAFATVEDLVSHLCTSDVCYRTTVLAEFLDRNQAPMFITLYFIVTRLPDSLRSIRDHFLSLDPTSLTVDLLEQHLLAAETSAVAVGAARGTPRPPFFEGCSPSPIAHFYASVAAADVLGAEDVGDASASAKRRSGKGKGSRRGGGGSGSGGGGNSGGSGGSGGGGSSGSGGGGGSGGGSGGVGGGGGGSGGIGGSGGGGTGGGRTGARRGVKHAGGFTLSTASSPASTTLGVLSLVTTSSALTGQFCLDLDFDVILSAMYASSVSAEGDCYWCVPPDPGIAAAPLGASESGTLPGTSPAEALHTFTLDSGASRCFFCDSTTLTPLPTPVPVRLADPSGGPVVASSSTVLPCPAVPSGSLSGLHLPSFSTILVSTTALQNAMVTTTTLGGQRVSICTCTRTGRHLATFTRQPGSSLYTLATKSPQVAASAQVSASGQVAPPCSCRLLSHQTLLWHHRLGHPSLPRLCAMHSRLLTLLIDVWGPARVTGQGHERYFFLVVDDYTRYTMVFPLRNKGQVVDVLIPRIRTVRLQLHERFITDFPVLCLHSDRGGEFSSDLLRDFCRGEGILKSFMLPASLQQNGIAERRIGLVMEVARTSMIHVAAPHFLWPFAVRASCLTSLFPYRSAPLPPLLLFLAPGPPPVDPLPPQGPAPSGVSQVDPPPGAVPGEVAVDSRAARGTAAGGAEPGGAKPGGADTGGRHV